MGLVGSALACSEPAAVRREPAATHSAAPSSTTPTADTAQPSGPRFGLPVDATATFDGQGAGWVVYGPGSAHSPTVAGGRVLVLYLLPQGAIEFTPPA